MFTVAAQGPADPVIHSGWGVDGCEIVLLGWLNKACSEDARPTGHLLLELVTLEEKAFSSDQAPGEQTDKCRTPLACVAPHLGSVHRSRLGSC